MKTKSKKSKAQQSYSYYFKSIRFYVPRAYDDFQDLCRENGTTITRELNALMHKAIKSKEIISNVANFEI